MSETFLLLLTFDLPVWHLSPKRPSDALSKYIRGSIHRKTDSTKFTWDKKCEIWPPFSTESPLFCSSLETSRHGNLKHPRGAPMICFDLDISHVWPTFRAETLYDLPHHLRLHLGVFLAWLQKQRRPPPTPDSNDLMSDGVQLLLILSKQNTAFLRSIFAAAILLPATDDLPATTGARWRRGCSSCWGVELVLLVDCRSRLPRRGTRGAVVCKRSNAYILNVKTMLVLEAWLIDWPLILSSSNLIQVAHSTLRIR